MSSQMAKSGDTTVGLDTDGNGRSRATEVMDQALELAAGEQLSVSSESDDEEDVSATKPTTTQRRQQQNAKFNSLYVPKNPLSSGADSLQTQAFEPCRIIYERGN